MATMEAPTTAQTSAAARPYDRRLSSRLDCIIIETEATKPRTIRRGWMRLQKRIAERQVPAWYPEVTR